MFKNASTSASTIVFVDTRYAPNLEFHRSRRLVLVLLLPSAYVHLPPQVTQSHKYKEGMQMKASPSFSGRGTSAALLTLALALALVVTCAAPGHAQTLFRQISQDTFTNSSSQHMTEVEPGAFANGPVIVAASGRPHLRRGWS